MEGLKLELEGKLDKYKAQKFHMFCKLTSNQDLFSKQHGSCLVDGVRLRNVSEEDIEDFSAECASLAP